MKFRKFIGPIVGIIITVLSIHILYSEFTNPKHQFSKLSFQDFWLRLTDLDTHQWILALLFTIIAYFSLAGYDRIALKHLNKNISWTFITLSSFTTYALSHNIGASIFSGAAIRYRAYSTKGLVASEVALLVGFCSFTFTIGAFFLGAITLFLEPNLFVPLIPFLENLFSTKFSVVSVQNFSRGIAIFFTLFLLFYIVGSWLKLKPLKIGKKFQINYPNLKIVAQQFIIGPLEIIGAAGIIYAALPQDVNISFLIVLGAFLLSFSIGILSNAPGSGLGVLEIIFINLVPDLDAADVLIALIIFRLLYLIIPLFISLIIVALFEINEYRKRN